MRGWGNGSEFFAGIVFEFGTWQHVLFVRETMDLALVVPVNRNG